MWIAIISALAGIIGTFFVIFIGLRSKQVFRPVLAFNSGLLYASDPKDIPKPFKKGFKKATVSTLIYGANVPQNSEVVFVCPYLLINNSKLPIINITLQLTYASKYAIENEPLIKKGIDFEVVFGFPPEADKCREVQIIDSMAQIRCTIPVLREGEKIVIPDLMKFTNLDCCEESDNENHFVGRGLAKKLREIKKMCDFCVVDAFVFSESCPPISRRIKLLWFDTNSDKELNSLMNEGLKAFWGGKFPEPGLYFNPLWPLGKKFIVEEYAETIIPKLRVVKTSEDRYFCWENALKSERGLFITKMPAWNYYQLSDLDTDDLLMRSGYQRVINGEHMGKMPMWNIFKRLIK